MLSAQPIDMVRNCLVTCSPKRVRRGARSEKRLSANSLPAKREELVGAVFGGGAVGEAVVVEVIVVGAITEG